MILIRHVEREHITHIILYNVYIHRHVKKPIYIIIMINPMFDAPHVYYMWFFYPKRPANWYAHIIYAARIYIINITAVFVYLESGWKKNNKRIIHRRSPRSFSGWCAWPLWTCRESERESGRRWKKRVSRKIHGYTILYNLIGKSREGWLSLIFYETHKKR